MKNFELYIIIILLAMIVWILYDSIKHYRGLKRKLKNLHYFAKEGEVRSQNQLAKHYQRGEMVKKDCQKAAFWYQKAAFKGDREARNHLKDFFEYNKKNIKKTKC